MLSENIKVRVEWPLTSAYVLYLYKSHWLYFGLELKTLWDRQLLEGSVQSSIESRGKHVLDYRVINPE